MKKKNLKSLKLNKNSISNLHVKREIKGGTGDTCDSYFPCPADTDFPPCQSSGCWSQYSECICDPNETLGRVPCKLVKV